MRDWQPVSTSSKGRLARLGLEEFGARGFSDVNVVELAARSGVTTGSLYHHFGSKLGLYDFVRVEVERRVLDRMAGAAAARAGDGVSMALKAALMVGFDYAVSGGFARLLGEPHPERDDDPVEELLAGILERGRSPTARLVVAAWRAALQAAAAGKTEALRAKDALDFLF